MIIFAYVVLNILGGAITAAIAGDKHRSALGWFFIGFLFPVLGIILAIVLPPNAPAATSSRMTDAAGQPLNWWNLDAK